MIKIIKEDTSRDSVYYKVLSKLSLGVATSKIYAQPNIGLAFDIEPTDDAINKVVSKLKSLGFTEVDRYEDDSYLNDSYIVFTNEINGERVVCGIVYNARDNFAFVNANYDEIEDSDYFNSLEEDWRDGKFTKEDLDKYISSIDEKVEAIGYSLTKMAEKHPEFSKEFLSEVKAIRNKFDHLSLII